MKPASSAAPMAASSRRIASVASARTAMMASVAPIAKRGDRRALDDRERVALEEEPVRAGRRVGAVAVGDDVAARARRCAAAGATCRRSGSRRRHVRAGRTAAIVAIVAVGPRSRIDPAQALEGAGRVAASRSVGSAAPARSSRIRRPGLAGVLSSRHRRRRLDARPADGGVERGEVGRLGRAVRVDGRGLRGRLGRLEAQVRVVARGPVDHRVPGAGPLADPLERRDRQVAVRGLGRLEDREHLRRVVVVLVEDRVDPGRVDRGERQVRRIRARSGRIGAARIPRAARRRSRARPSGRGSGRACPCRPCRCTRSGRPGRTGSRSRT